METEKRIEIRWRDLDSYDHVNHVVFLTYLEECRDEWLGGALGDPGEAWNWVLVHVDIDYRREVRLADDEVVATCRLERIGTKSVTTYETVRTTGGDVCAEARVVLVARDRRSGASRALTARERTAFEAVAP